MDKIGLKKTTAALRRTDFGPPRGQSRQNGTDVGFAPSPYKRTVKGPNRGAPNKKSNPSTAAEIRTDLGGGEGKNPKRKHELNKKVRHSDLHFPHRSHWLSPYFLVRFDQGSLKVTWMRSHKLKVTSYPA